MKRIFAPLATAFFFSIVLSYPALAANAPPSKGSLLPSISLPIPKDSVEKQYLGLSGQGVFKIPQIKARMVIIQIFSMYCPICQKDAPGVNLLYEAIENRPDLKGRIKLIGIGAGNSSFEVGVYKKTYTVPFPLFPDKDFTIHKACGEVRTPYYIVIKINDDGTHQIILSQLGGFAGPEAFLEQLLKDSGLN